MTYLRQFLTLFNRREQWLLVLLAGALVVRAGAEIVGVASIMPFMAVLADPTTIETNRHLSALYDGFGFQTPTGFLTALGLAVVALLALANAFSALALYAMLRFSWGMHDRLAVRLMAGYLQQPYTFFVGRNSASLHKMILSEVKSVVKELLNPALNVAARGLVVLALMGLLIALDPMLAAVIFTVLGGTYGTLYLVVQQRQRQLGRERVDADERRFQVVAEAFGAIKDVKVLSCEESLMRQFRPASRRYSGTTAANSMMAQLPRYPVEAIAFGGIVLIALYYLHVGDGLAQILPVISLYAFAGYRLMPELQQLFAGLAQIRFNSAALDNLSRDLRLASAVERPGETEPLPFEEVLELQDVAFAYPGERGYALEGVSLRIRRNETIGLVGASGSGKTTLVDLLLGLYEVGEGLITVDGRSLSHEVLGAWRRRIGYIPQKIYLKDDSIAANIAFGQAPDEIDLDRVEQAARAAHLHDFVSSLEKGYETMVGERGVRLSGGQSQRIGIARALYHDPDVLIMDEATSSLDGITEAAVMEAIRGLAGSKTIIVIAHRLTTVQNADRIVMLEAGRVVDEGTFAELVRRNEAFSAMAASPMMA